MRQRDWRGHASPSLLSTALGRLRRLHPLVKIFLIVMVLEASIFLVIKGRLSERAHLGEVHPTQQTSHSVISEYGYPVSAISVSDRALTTPRCKRVATVTAKDIENQIALGLPMLVTDQLYQWDASKVSLETLKKHFGRTVRIEYVNATGDLLTSHEDPPSLFFTAVDHYEKDWSGGVKGRQRWPYVKGFDAGYFGLLTKAAELYPNGYYTDYGTLLGVKGSRSMIHADDTSNIHSLIFGKKIYILVAPEHIPKLMMEYVHVPLDPFAKSIQDAVYNHPMFRFSYPLILQLKGGDVLFQPKGWYHYVFNLETTFSIASWGWESYEQYYTNIADQNLKLAGITM
eukprot:TRINITY_DN258_c0_g1_i1.p1 TRINITY_DN258_c0_g1~~TRINITY_DN258_c0_g1_i1.p1  ORF type:complete len:343 (+),score=54.97 TRINITY_DN258_c0_g1_i1:166-1194(+)